MTDSPTPAEPGPVDPDDELASAHLDGEAGEDERARTDDPAVQARVSAFAQVAEQVRDVPPPPPGLVDDQVARAMAVFEGDDRVVPLEQSRSGTRPWWQRIPLGAVAAALVVVALIGAVGLASTTDDDDDATATGAFDESTSDASSGGDSAGTEDSDAMAGTMEEGAALESAEQPDEAGTPVYDSYDALAEDLRAELAPFPDQAEDQTAVAESDAGTTAPERSAEGDDDAGDPCDAVGLLGLDPASVVVVRSATVAGEEVTAVVHDADDGRRITVVADAGCAVVDDRLL